MERWEEGKRTLNAASIKVRGIEKMGGRPIALRGQFNRTFIVGLAGATIASLELCAFSLAAREIADEGRAQLKSTSDCVSGRQPITGTFRSDIEMIASNLPPT